MQEPVCVVIPVPEHRGDRVDDLGLKVFWSLLFLLFHNLRPDQFMPGVSLVSIVLTPRRHRKLHVVAADVAAVQLVDALLSFRFGIKFEVSEPQAGSGLVF